MGNYKGFVSVVCVIVMLICGFLGIKSIFYSSSSNVVPDVVGMTSQEAITAMKDAGFMPFIDKVTASAPTDTVVSQSFEAGTKQTKGSTVYLRVSFGGSSMEIPDVTGMKLEDAVKALQDLGLTVDEIRKIPNKEHAAGIVFAQNPSSPQTVDTGTKITLLVSSTGDESSLIQIPNVIGKTQAEAIKAIEASGLKLGDVQLKRSATVTEGCVVSQTPNAGLSVSTGTAVSISVSSAEAVDDLSIERETSSQKTAPIKRVIVENKEELEREAQDENLAKKPQSKKKTKEVAKQKIDVNKKVASKKELAKKQETLKNSKQKIAENTKTKKQLTQKTPDVNKSDSKFDVKKSDVTQQTKKTIGQTTQVAKSQTQLTSSVAQPTATVASNEQKKQTVEQSSYTGKIAKIRYQTPPIAGNNLSLKIVINDSNGTRVLRDGVAHSLEYISMNTRYQGTAKVTIYLGGEEVWHDKFN